MVRLGAMGDILHALPAATALRQAHPDWTINWAVEPHWAPLLTARSHTDSEFPIPTTSLQPVANHIHFIAAKRWGRHPLSPATFRDIARARHELRRQNYDVTVDLQGAIRSAIIGRWANAPRMIGEDTPRERAARHFFNERIPTQGRHVIEQCLEVCSAITGEALPYTPAQLPIDPTAEAWCDRWLAANLGTRPFVLLNPGAGWGAKRWPTARYGQLAAELHAAGYAIAVNAGPAEDDLARQVVAASAVNQGVSATTPTLGELTALTRRAALVIAGDTGPLHLANALGRRVVGIFGPTDPARNGPFGSQFRVLRHPESRRDHSRRTDPEAGLLTITVQSVFEAATELLRNAPQPTPTNAAHATIKGNA